MIKSDHSVLLRLPSGSGWRLRADVPATLNESVYFGAGGLLQRSEQVVLVERVDRLDAQGTITIKWSLRREDAKPG